MTTSGLSPAWTRSTARIRIVSRALRSNFRARQSMFWLQPGEMKTVEIEYIPAVNRHNVPLKQLTVSAWNAQPLAVATR